jgi:hypothetical protein
MLACEVIDAVNARLVIASNVSQDAAEVSRSASLFGLR